MWLISAVAAIGLLVFAAGLGLRISALDKVADPVAAPPRQRAKLWTALVLVLLATGAVVTSAVLDASKGFNPLAWLVSLPIATVLSLWAGLLAVLAHRRPQNAGWPIAVLVLASAVTLAVGSCIGLTLGG